MDQVRGGCGGGRQPLVQAPRVHTIAEGMAATEAGNEGRARTGGSGGKGLCTGEGESWKNNAVIIDVLGETTSHAFHRLV